MNLHIGKRDRSGTRRTGRLAIGASFLGLAAAVAAIGPAHALTGDIVEYAIPTPSASPLHITTGADGNLWFTESQNSANKIGKITPAGVITEYAIPTAISGPSAITPGPDGNVWFTEVGCGVGKIAKITPAGAITEYALPNNCAKPRGITTGPDGNLWITEAGNQRIAKFVIATGAVTEYRLPAGSDPYWIMVGPDNKMWFTEAGTAKVGRVNIGATKVTFDHFTIPNCAAGACVPFGLTSGPDGKIWYTTNTGLVGSFTTAGVASGQFTAPAGSLPKAIVNGPDGNLWFTEFGTDKIARMTTAGVITEWALPGAGTEGPMGMTNGPDGGVWFTEFKTAAEGGNKIGRITP